VRHDKVVIYVHVTNNFKRNIWMSIPKNLSAADMPCPNLKAEGISCRYM
jgi:hypothetical protein